MANTTSKYEPMGVRIYTPTHWEPVNRPKSFVQFTNPRIASRLIQQSGRKAAIDDGDWNYGDWNYPWREETTIDDGDWT